MASCSKENINLFFKYLRGQLSRKEECLIDAHLQDCQNCLLNFAYVEEIVMYKHKLSMDEQTLLLRYISDPICQQQLDKLKQDILADITDIQKQEIKQQILNQLNTLNSNNAANSTLKPEKSRTVANISNQRSLFISKYIAVVFAVIFLGLSTSICLIFIKNGLLFSSSDFLSSTPSKNTIDDTHHKLTNNISVTTNLYQDLDLAIDKYLERQDPTFIKQAESIAKAIERKYDDKYGVDLVMYYETIPDSIKPNLLLHRKALTKLTNQPIGKNYQQRLEETERLAKQLTSLGNLVESYKAKVLIGKLKVKLLKYEEAKIIINEGLFFSRQNNYVILQAYFLLWQAKRLVEVSEFALAEDIFEETIAIGKRLAVEELFASPSMTLAASHLKNNDNIKALKIAQNVLANCKNCNIEHTISLLQIAGVSAFNNNFTDLSRVYLNKAIELSKEYNNSYLVVMSYTFLGVTLSGSKEFDKAEEFYLKAKEVARKVEEETTNLEVSSIILGYQAKAKLMAGHSKQAIALYQEAIAAIKKLNIDNDLEMAQLEEGLATALKQSGKDNEAETHFAIAKKHQRTANENRQIANCLLSFTPNNCDSIKN